MKSQMIYRAGGLACALASLVFALPAAAKPIAFARGTTLMAEYGGGSMFETQAFYAPKYFYSAGVSALRFDADESWRTQTQARVNYLAKRWNAPKSQANVFVYAGLGSAHNSVGQSGFASSFGVQADYETRWLYTSARSDLNVGLGQRIRVDTVQIGVAPYAHDYKSVATFFLLQARDLHGSLPGATASLPSSSTSSSSLPSSSTSSSSVPSSSTSSFSVPIYRGVEWAALLRVFKGNTWLEAGITQDRTLQAMLMFNF